MTPPGAPAAGPLQQLLDVPGTTDVLVNGPGSVWVDRGDGLERVDLDVGAEDGLRALAVRLAATAGRRLDDASPCVVVKQAQPAGAVAMTCLDVQVQTLVRRSAW